ncbi:aminoglycoside phosphotransferase family protein [Luedemannella flava]
MAVAEAFGLGRPVRAMTAHTHRSSPTWVLDTVDGRVLVKQVEVAGREAEVIRAARFEARVGAGGVDVPRPVPPAGEAVGYATYVAGFGWARAYEWLDGRDLRDDDEVAGWLGATLAAVHAVEPVDAPERVAYGIHPAERWHAWLAAGERLARPWAPTLRAGLPAILDISAWVAAALDRAGDYVLTHRDVEPWNVMITSSGPVLFDWDPAGPDSAGLEACHAAFAFATRAGHDWAALRATLTAYAAAGGVVPADPDLLARRVGMRINRLAWRLSMSTGAQPLGPNDLATVDARAREQVEQLPGFAADLRAVGTAIAAEAGLTRP